MEKLQVVKIGGKVIDREDQLNGFLKSFASLPGRKILVHGGGKLATHLAERLGLPVKMVNGRRVTTDEMIDVIIMTYGGLINKKIVAKLQALGTNAIGLTGADLNLIKSTIRRNTNGLDWGWVGDPTEVNKETIASFLQGNHVPVIAPLTHDQEGHLLNTNADTIANKLAEALSETYEAELNYTFDLRGVMKDMDDPNSLIEDLRLKQYQEFKMQGIINEGMLPKLDNAFEAISNGVKVVRIINHAEVHKINSNEGGYTRIH